MSAQREMTLQEWVEQLPEIHAARKEYDALAARLAEAERDAARYRWLRDSPSELMAICEWRLDEWCPVPSYCDAAIDAAMAADGKEGGR